MLTVQYCNAFQVFCNKCQKFSNEEKVVWGRESSGGSKGKVPVRRAKLPETANQHVK